MAINFRSNTIIKNLRVGPLSGGGGNGGGGGDSLVTSGLIGHWDMGDVNSYPGSGTTVTDLTGNGYSATINAYSSGGTATGTGESTYFSGGDVTTDYVSNSFTFGGSLLNMAISFWIKDTNTTNPGNSSVQFDGLLAFRSYPQQDLFRIFTHTTFEFYNISNFYSTYNNSWTNITTSVDNGNFTTYVNGTSVASFTNTDTVPSSNQRLFLHYGEENTGYWAQTALYNRALTASEVLQNFNALKSRYGY